ncbi:VanZ family protein [Paenibacillus oenotherae]|uniref:VanZ family protein n=1 Tax=Paenibacillus oenotherae TaxID=1435645 RepID=A0ABS7DAH2_9BACL|nr:VanZ family protein [Paenibacillus oenotherae]MBW7476939.1 VanZ family protein [Paenibacillus oenotherae]
MKPLIFIITILYTGLLIYWMFIGFGRSHTRIDAYQYNIIPLQTLKMYVLYADHFSLRNWLVNMVGNVAVFVPFGIALPYLFRLKLMRFMILFIAALFMLELLQLVLHRGSFDIDDVLLNTLGAIMGYIIYRLGILLGRSEGA